MTCKLNKKELGLLSILDLNSSDMPTPLYLAAWAVCAAGMLYSQSAIFCFLAGHAICSVHGCWYLHCSEKLLKQLSCSLEF